MAAAEGRELVTVQKPVEPVAGKFGDNDGIHERSNNPDESDMQAVVKHDSDSFSSSSAASETEDDSYRSANGVHVAPRKSHPDVIQLRTQSEMSVQAQIHSPAGAVGETIARTGAAESTERTVRTAKQDFGKRSHSA